MSDLALQAKKYCDAGDYESAWNIAQTMLTDRPKEANPSILASYVLWKMEKPALAYQLAVRGTQMAPHEASAWINLGITAHEIWEIEESEQAYKTALNLAKNSAERAMATMNLSALYIDTGRFADAEKWGRESLKLKDSPKAKANIGFGLLGQRKWEGWDWYSYSLGLNARLAMQYGDELPWDGSKGKTVAVYGEQGLGDEISFASVIPDAAKDCKKLILDCHPKVEGLFKRSFPQVKVYGTRNAKEGDGVQWDQEDWQIDASIALGELGKFYRRTDESFTGESYLVPDPDRREMWKALFGKKKKPVIGIAWSGGIAKTGRKFRTLTLESLKPILESVDAHWVSLQYKDAFKEIAEFKKKNPQIDLVQYPWGTLTQDYDDTAAMVAELDLVISVDTAVVHLCGAIGKECWVMLHGLSQWRYAVSVDLKPFYKSVEVVKQKKLGEWTPVIGEMVGRLRKRFGLKEAA